MDQWWAETLDALRGDVTASAARVLNAIGRFPLSVVIVLIVALVLWRRRPRLDAATFLAAEATSWAIANLTKLAVARPRPLGGLVDTASASFPSGHTAFAAVTAVTLVGLCRAGKGRRGWALPAAALAVTMAWSRTYLMVHWFTDVVAGLTVGAAVGLTALAVRDWLLKRAAAAAREHARGEAQVNETLGGPAPIRRLAAVAALLLVAAVLVATVLILLNDPLILVAQILLLGVVVTATWVAVTRAGAMRWLAAAIAIAGIVAVVALEFQREGRPGLSLVVRIALLLVAAWLGRYALGRDARTLQQSETPGAPVPAAKRGALIMNLKSGGGKAKRFDLPKECVARGIEPIVLAWGDDLSRLAQEAKESRAHGSEPLVEWWGDDLSKLAHDAIDRGANVIGMAGGDGSQALVASIAAERGVSMVVIPAGTRNHFALDLGLDRDDVVGALDAYGTAVERTIDLGDVNGRVFVNNVSMGLYAIIVQSPEYRDAKMDTTLAALPQMLGPDTKPFDLRFTSSDGVPHDGAHVVQVSNNPYGETLASAATRPRLDTGELGVYAIVAPEALGVTRFLAQLALGRPERYEGYSTWSQPRFEITSGSPIAVGLDGESLTMNAPLVFTSRPGVLRVRLPRQAFGYSPAATSQTLRQMVADLWRVTLGRRVHIGD